jgi:hypothetical protein
MTKHIQLIQKAAPANVGLTMDGDYVIVPFRMLSAGIIPGHWVEFSKEVLEKAVSLFNEVTIFPDHYPSIREWIGVATNVRFTDSKGVFGVDADFKIDALKNPDIIRGLQMNPPAIKHCSVGIHINWKPSHEFKYGWEFRQLLGEEVNGSIVRMIVTEIVSVDEVSLVYKGADPHATKLVKIQENKFNMTVKKQTLILLGHNVNSNIEEIEMTPDELHAVIQNYQNKEKENLETLSKLRKLLGNYESNSDLVDNTEIILKEYDELCRKEARKVEEARANALKFYKLYADGKENAGIVSLIESASFESAIAMGEEYKILLEKKFPKNANGNRASFQPETEEKNNVNFKDYEV